MLLEGDVPSELSASAASLSPALQMPPVWKEQHCCPGGILSTECLSAGCAGEIKKGQPQVQGL